MNETNITIMQLWPALELTDNETLIQFSETRCWITKVAQKFPKKYPHKFYVKSAIFSQQPKIVAKYFGHFCKRLSSKELSKITQSGHTAVTDHKVDAFFFYFHVRRKSDVSGLVSMDHFAFKEKRTDVQKRPTLHRLVFIFCELLVRWREG